VSKNGENRRHWGDDRSLVLDLDRGFVRRSNLQRYGFAVAAVTGASFVGYLLFQLVQSSPAPIFFAAVMASAWYGGVGPGLLATTISFVVAGAMTAPGGIADASDAIRLVLFATVAIATSSIHSIWRKDRISMLRVQEELERRVRIRTEQLTQEIAVRQQAEAEARASEERFRQLFEEAPVAYHELDRDGVICRVNRAECELLGYPAEQLIGKAFWEFAAADARETSEDWVRGKLSDGAGSAAAGPHVGPYVTKDGRPIWLEAHERVILDASGAVCGIRTTLLDITARRHAEEEILRLNAELEERVRRRTAELQRSNEDLQQFAYVVSHDLQEPLRAISGYTSLIEKRYKSRLDSDADEFIEFIVEGAERMQRLITDLLEYSRVGSRDVRPYGPVDLGAALDAALLNLQRSIDESGARVERLGKLPDVLGDKQRLTQLLQNLVGNALKYRADRSPIIRISAEPRDGQWICSVSDNGIGFDQAHAERIFGVFRRLHGARYPGTGIGLAIAKRIVEFHGGRMWAVSSLGEGSTFYFTLPAAELAATDSAVGLTGRN
jgi:PAS domain S-box-containing protein